MYLYGVQKSKLTDFLRTFQTRDFRRFREYLASPFFNKREDLQAFYQVVLDDAPGFYSELTTREAIWKRYAGTRPFDVKEMNYLSNFLLQHAENYVAMENYQNDPTSKGIPVLSHCLQNGLTKHFRSVYTRARKSLTSEPYRDADWHLKAWRLADAEMVRFYSTRLRQADTSINSVVEHLDTFYLAKKLELSSEILNLNQILSEKLDTAFTQELVTLVDQRKSNASIIEIRKLILNILGDPEDVESFYKLRELLPLARRIFWPGSVTGIFSYAQNFCIRRIRMGDKSFEGMLFKIYKESIEARVMFQDGKLSPWDFKNVCSIALKLREFTWVEEFIDRHGERIPEDFQTNAIAFNRGNLYFHQEKFRHALRSLNGVEFNDVFYALDTRRLMLMIYFKQGESEALFSLVSSFRTFLSRNRVISETNRKAYRNFVDWVNRIYRLSEWELRQQKGELREKLAGENLIIQKEWLLEALY